VIEDEDQGGILAHQDRFQLIPRWVFEALKGDASTYMVYGALANRANEHRDTFPTKRTMATDTGLSINTIDRSLAKLRNIGAIEVVPRFWKDGGQASNSYKLPLHPINGDGVNPKLWDGKEGEPGEVERVLLPPSASLQEVEVPVVRNETVASMAPLEDREIAEALANHVSLVTGRNSRAVPTKADYNVARLMRERDGYRSIDIEVVLNWLVSGSERAEFWKMNVLSMTKLRKHMPRLVMEIKREMNPAKRQMGETERRMRAIAEHHGIPYIGDLT
jgi:hypothetical protein